jgi:hypothetical protein
MEDYAYIPAVPDKKDVLRRLGIKPGGDGILSGDIESLIEYSKSLFIAQGRAETCDIEHKDETNISINGTLVKSASLSKLLGGSPKAFLMCAAIPQKYIDKINMAIEEGRGFRAMVLDAYASEYADASLDYIMKTKNAQLIRTRQSLTRHRFSAGYGDLDIKYQKVFFDLLDMRSLGVSINGKYLLMPEKSVIAIAGVV